MDESTHTQEALLRQCYEEALSYMASLGPEVAGFAGPLPALPVYCPQGAVGLPSGADLPAILASASAASRRLVEAVIAASLVFNWQQTYTEAEVGADFLSRSGWCHVAGPEGPLVVPGMRMFLGYWGPGLDYPPHWHEPEELYIALAGSGCFSSPGKTPRQVAAGDHVHHASNQHHATKFGPDGFLALILWRGEQLAVDLAIVPAASPA